MSSILGYDVWKRRGGWYHNPDTDVNEPACRHQWNPIVVRRKQGIFHKFYNPNQDRDDKGRWTDGDNIDEEFEYNPKEKNIIPLKDDPDLNYYIGDNIPPHDYIEKLAEKLESIGYKRVSGYSDETWGFRVSHSSTQFGKSSYIEGGFGKIRFSDHSVTNVGRLMEEIHISDFNVGDVVFDLHRKRSPEKFVKRFIIEQSYNEFEMNDDWFENNPGEDIILGRRISKKGTGMTKVRRTVRNKKSFYVRRKQNA
jgi:hypothetical protein